MSNHPFGGNQSNDGADRVDQNALADEEFAQTPLDLQTREERRDNGGPGDNHQGSVKQRNRPGEPDRIACGQGAQNHRDCPAKSHQKQKAALLAA